MNLSYNTSVKRRSLNKIKKFEFEIQPLQPFMYDPMLQGFHSGFLNT
jgi:hypothetical protein